MSKSITAGGMLLACTVFFSWLALTYGRDVPWDYHNYHAYAVHILTHDRLSQDFFPAGLQGYLNPIGFVPLALILQLHLDSMGTEVLLACLHSLNAFFLYLMCRNLASDLPCASQWVMALGWLLGVSTPVFLIHLGSTFVDPIGSVLVLASIWLVMSRNARRSTLLAGLLAGLSMAVKLSNTPFAIAIAIAICLPWRTESSRQWLVRIGTGAAGMLTGFILAQGYWSWRLYETMGNPFFPMFNGLFHSPYFTTESVGAFRFQPATLTDLATLPYRIALSDSWTYLEMLAPTPIPLVLCALSIAVGLKYLWKVSTGRQQKRPPESWLRLAAFVLVASILWIASSSNGRYGIPLFLLLGPMTALAALGLMAQRYALLLLTGLTAFQFLTFSYDGVVRWGSTQWTPQLMSVRIPEELSEAPHLFLSLSNPSYSVLVPHLHSDSVFVNLRSAYSIPSQGPSATKITSLISQYAGRTQVLFAVPRIKGYTADVTSMTRYYSAFIDRVSLRLQTEQCRKILLDAQPKLKTRFNRNLGPSMPVLLMSCPAVPSPPSPELARMRARASEIMNVFEDKCPKLFVPSRPQIEGAGQVWSRSYFNYDGIGLSVRFDKDRIQYGLSGQSSITYLGKASQWQEAVARFDCQLPGRGERGIDFFNTNEESATW
jgi:hypothetical protein